MAILQNELPLKYSIFQSSAQVEKLKYCALQHFIEKEVEIPKRFLCVQDLFLRGGTASISSIVIHSYQARGASLQFRNPLILCKTPLKMLVHSLTIMVMTPVTDVEIISNTFLRRKCLYIEKTYILGDKVLLLLKMMITMVMMVMMESGLPDPSQKWPL